MAVPRILITALRGGSGKTIVSLGLIASLRKRGMAIAPFKKGPDFIDAGWLALAAGHPCHNLDTFLMPSRQIHLSFTTRTLKSDLAVIEGNRGLYDGMDLEGSTSTSELAKLLKVPVALIIDCTKTTRTVAAMVLGCVQFDPHVNICGVILNRVAGARHESIIRQTVEQQCGLRVLGAIPKIRGDAFPERHMGLVPTPEHDWAEQSITQAAHMADKYLDLDTIEKIAREAPDLDNIPLTASLPGRGIGEKSPSPRIGIIRDAAFQFYYPENLEALEAAGAKIVLLNAVSDPDLGELDGLYIGGGFPETQAQALSANKGFRQDVRRLAEEGLPLYAECGGLMYLGERLVLDAVSYPMAGVLPVTFGFSERPQGHGYTIFEVARSNPFFEAGTQVRGHEFHYSNVLEWRGESEALAFKMIRGQGLDGKGDGLCYKNTLATYSHIHALGTPSWAEAMVKASVSFREKMLKV
ncbi:MAG: cobyrinate a,c-diamide synthase [Thermodesulfobacteriota bacterium]|nr:cobyrinate a,c-diamide synthase [Thermodesulfobacteriota bacterium]